MYILDRSICSCIFDVTAPCVHYFFVGVIDYKKSKLCCSTGGLEGYLLKFHILYNDLQTAWRKVQFDNHH